MEKRMDFSRRTFHPKEFQPKPLPSPYSITGFSNHPPEQLKGAYPKIPAGCTLFQISILAPSGQVIPETWVTFLIPPQNISEEFTFLANSVRVREGYVVDRWGPDLQMLLVSGTTGGFYTDSGLTAIERSQTVAYQNLQALFELYRHNGIFGLENNSGVPSQAGRVFLSFGKSSWIGRFDRFSIKEDKPYLLNYDFGFVVYAEYKPLVDLPQGFSSFDDSKLQKRDLKEFKRDEWDVPDARISTPPIQNGAGGISSSAKADAGITSEVKGGTGVVGGAGGGAGISGGVGRGSGISSKSTSVVDTKKTTAPESAAPASAKLSEGSPYTAEGGRVDYSDNGGKYKTTPGRKVDMHFTPKTADGLDKLSGNVGQKMEIYSGSEKTAVHSGKTTQHYKDSAVDIVRVGNKTPAQMSVAERQDFLNKCKDSGAGFAQYEPGRSSGHFHVDWGPRRGKFNKVA